MNYIGDFAEDGTVRLFFSTNNRSGGAVAPSSAFEAADVVIYKDGSATQKATTNGITMTSPFDAVTGLHLVEIDTSVDTGDTGFWQAGHDYTVVLAPDETVDSQTVVQVLGQFGVVSKLIGAISGRIPAALGANGNIKADIRDIIGVAAEPVQSPGFLRVTSSDVIFHGTISGTVTSTSFTMPGLSSVDDAYRDLLIHIYSGTGEFQVRRIISYDGTTKVATINRAWSVNPVGGDLYVLLVGASAWDDPRSEHAISGSFGEGVKAESLNTQAKADAGDAVWNEARSGHTTSGTFGESFNGVVSGAAATGTLSTTEMTTDLTEATDDHFIGRIIVWITGALAGQATDITDYVGSTKKLVFTAVTDTPSNGDRFVIV